MSAPKYMSLARSIEHLASGGVLRDRDGDRYWLDQDGHLMWDGFGDAAQVKGAFDSAAHEVPNLRWEGKLAFAKSKLRKRGKQGRP